MRGESEMEKMKDLFKGRKQSRVEKKTRETKFDSLKRGTEETQDDAEIITKVSQTIQTMLPTSSKLGCY